MTCSDFRKNIENNPEIHGTRAERAVQARHWKGCASCRRWLLLFEAAMPQLSPEEHNRLEALARTDIQDPEVREIIEAWEYSPGARCCEQCGEPLEDEQGDLCMFCFDGEGQP
jgi:hypothetical protein